MAHSLSMKSRLQSSSEQPSLKRLHKTKAVTKDLATILNVKVVTVEGFQSLIESGTIT